MSYQHFQHLTQQRRSIYQLNDQLPISQAEVIRIVEHALLHTPSSFNSQSTRISILFGEQHHKLWEMTKEILKKIVPTDQFSSTEQKIALFQAAAGSILFFEEQEVIKKLQNQFPTYADNFPIWSEQTNAMHQYAIWLALSSQNIGANLQHYNPLIDEAVQQQWQLPKTWKLRAQMVFGGIIAPAAEKNFEPIDTRLKVFK